MWMDRDDIHFINIFSTHITNTPYNFFVFLAKMFGNDAFPIPWRTQMWVPNGKKKAEEQGVKARSLAHNTLEG
jgi:hypothetical protein